MERRSVSRFGLKINGTICHSAGANSAGANGTEIPVRSKNVCARGAYVTTKELSKAGKNVELHLPWPANGCGRQTRLVVSGRILRVEELFGKEYGIAISFFDSPALEGVSEPDGTTPSIFGPDHVKQGAFDYSASLRRTRQYIEENYPEEISRQKAARVAAMERTYFSGFFKEKVGINFTTWLKQVRISKAIWNPAIIPSRKLPSK